MFQAANVAGTEAASIMADLDGDGRPDIIKTGNAYSDSTVYLVKNKSNVGSISFAPTLSYHVPAAYRSPQSVDLDGDNRPELIYVHYNADSMVILKNVTGAAVLCPGANTLLYSNIPTGTVFQWQKNPGSGFVNISPNSNYSGVNTSTLQLTGVPSAWYGYQYRCKVDGQTGAAQKLRFVNTFTSYLFIA